MPASSESQLHDFQYPRAPITEAVIELRLESPLRESVLRKASVRFAKFYPGVQELKNVTVQVEFTEHPAAVVNDRHLLFRRAAEDETQLAILVQNSLIISQLAPYLGWKEFVERFERDFKIWKSVVGFVRISQIGMRYINRIDIPISKHAPIVDYESYLNVYPNLPANIISTEAYTVNVRIPMTDIQSQLTINSATIPSPLYGYASYLLDLDFGRVEEPPQNLDEIKKLLHLMRIKKNQIFEACITDKARELFRA